MRSRSTACSTLYYHTGISHGGVGFDIAALFLHSTLHMKDPIHAFRENCVSQSPEKQYSVSSSGRSRRVLFVATQLDKPEAYMIAELARTGVEAIAIIGPSRRHASILEAADIPVHVWTWSRAWWSPKRRKLRELLAGIQPDIIHAFDNAALYETWRSLPMKTVS